MFRDDKPTASILKTRGLIAALLILAAALALTAAPTDVEAQTASNDARLTSITIDGTAIPDFKTYHIFYRYGVIGSQVTFDATTFHSEASWRVTSHSDADGATDGFQVDLNDTGGTRIQVRVTAENDNIKDYTVTIDRGSTDDFRWKATDDFNTLTVAGNTGPSGIWSDGTTIWVSDFSGRKVYAYNMVT